MEDGPVYALNLFNIADRGEYIRIVTEEMIPNCYASMSLIQPHNQNTNDVPMRLYGVKTLFVEDRRTRMPLELKAPDTIRPRESFTVEIAPQGVVDWDKVHSVVIADYRPGGTTGAYDTLQAAHE